MEQLQFCVICGNAHEGSCSTEAIYFYWIPEEGETEPNQVYIVGDWSKWAKKEKMNKISTHTNTPYFSISLALSQGPHQYKFIVDGVWRHDQNSHTVTNSYGNANNYVQILPKKSYLRKHPGELLKITSDFCIQNLKIIGSWDDWTTERPMNLSYNPLKKCEQNAIYLDLQPNQTYQFKFKHGSQYFVDEKYPTVINSLGTLNNLIVVYNKKIEVETPNKTKFQSCPSPTKVKNFNGKFFNWKKVQEKLNLPYERVQGHSMCSVGEYLYIFGGKSRSQFYNTLLKINLCFDKVQALEVYPDGRAFHAMKPYGNKIIIYGGNNQEILSDYQVFNVSENKWHPTLNIAKSIATAKCEKQSCVIFESLMIFFGGCYNADNSSIERLSDQIQVLDLEKMQWIQSIHLQGEHPAPRFAHTAQILNTDMYIFGGVYNLQNQNLNDIWKINLTNVNNLRWIKLNPAGTAPQPRHGHSINHLKELLIIFGGINDQNQLLNDVFVYSSTQNLWIKPILQGQPPRPRFNHAAVSILDNQIIIFGGKTNDKGKNNQFSVLQPSEYPNIVTFLNNQDRFIEIEEVQKDIEN